MSTGMRCGVNSRLVPLLLVCLTFSLPLLDVAYASPGTRVIGCRAVFGAAIWSIVAIIGWENAGTLLLILIDLYRAVGGMRVGRIQDSVSGTGSKEYTFNNIQGGPGEWFELDVQYLKDGDYVHNADRPGMMECPRPATQTETTTLTVTTLSTTNVTERETATVQVNNPPSEGDPLALFWIWFGSGSLVGIIVSAIFFWLYFNNQKGGAPPTPPPQNEDFGT